MAAIRGLVCTPTYPARQGCRTQQLGSTGSTCSSGTVACCVKVAVGRRGQQPTGPSSSTAFREDRIGMRMLSCGGCARALIPSKPTGRVSQQAKQARSTGGAMSELSSPELQVFVSVRLPDCQSNRLQLSTLKLSQKVGPGRSLLHEPPVRKLSWLYLLVWYCLLFLELCSTRSIRAPYAHMNRCFRDRIRFWQSRTERFWDLKLRTAG